MRGGAIKKKRQRQREKEREREGQIRLNRKHTQLAVYTWKL